MEHAVTQRQARLKREPSTALGQRIIAATVEEFAAKGILGARVAEITRLAGTTDPAFYRYFPSLRQAALFIMSEYYWQPLNRRVAHFEQVTSDPAMLFEAMLQALIHSSADDPSRPWLAESKVFRIVVAQTRNPFLLPDSLQDADYLAFLTKFEEILRRGQEAGVFAPGIPPGVLARTLVATLHALLVENSLDPQSRHVSEDEIRRVAHRLVGFRT